VAAGDCEQGTAGIALGAEAERIALEQSAATQAGDQGVFGAAVVKRDAGAEDQSLHPQLLCCHSSAATDSQSQARGLGFVVQQPRRQDLQPSARQQFLQQEIQLRRDAMAMYIPDHGRMTQEAPPLPEIQPLPEALGARAQPIDHRTPVLVLPVRLSHPFPDQPPEPEHCGRGPQRIQPVTDRLHAAMAVGAMAVAGEGHDRAAMPPALQAHHHIDHGQAGAEQGDGSVWIQFRSRIRRPSATDGLTGLQWRWQGAVPPGEHHLIRLQRRLPRKLQSITACSACRPGMFTIQWLQIDQFRNDALQNTVA